MDFMAAVDFARLPAVSVDDGVTGLDVDSFQEPLDMVRILR